MPELPYRTPESPKSDGPVESTLGARRSTHPSRPLVRLMLPSLSVSVLVLCAMGAMGHGAHDGRIVLAGAALCVVVFAVGAVPSIARRHDRVEVYADGLVVLRGRARTVIPFDTVDAVWYVVAIQGSSWGDFARVTALRLVGHDGVAHTVPLELLDPANIVQSVERACSAVHLTAARETLARGEPLTFGTVTIDRVGITLRKASVRWRDLRLVRFQPGRVAFFRGRGPFPWRTVQIDSVPHPLLFTKLVQACAPRMEADDPLLKRFG